MLFLESVHFDRLLIIFGLVHFKVIEERAAASDLAEKSAASRVILLVLLEMFGEHFDFLGQNGDLHLRRSRVLIMLAVLGDELLLVGTLERHTGEGREEKR